LLATLGTILKWVILIPILVVVVLLAVANDQTVTVHLNPFDTDDPVLRVDLPLYQVAFILFVLGTLVGGLVAWRGWRKHRKRARDRRHETALWQARTEWSEQRKAEPGPSEASAFLPRPERS
jgi:uncharacterized integral membrane protein